MTIMTSRGILAVALIVTAAVMLFAPLAVQQVWWAGLLLLVLVGFCAITLFRWTRPRTGLYRRRHSRW
jgi:hypothetical protein